MTLRKNLQKILAKINIGVTTYDNLRLLNKIKDEYANLTNLSRSKLEKLALVYPESKSQILQDLFVLYELDFKRNGFFVEFGATDGVKFSNTYILENFYDWRGILAEPGRSWYNDLKKNRNCFIDNNCVWIKSNMTLKFSESLIQELSTLQKYTIDNVGDSRHEQNFIYDVQTISLLDLLDKYNAPKEIDYLSIDTEGSEYEILNNFDFSRYSFKIITCEHNYTENREKIKNLLESNGYKRKFESISQWDDWFVKI